MAAPSAPAPLSLPVLVACKLVALLQCALVLYALPQLLLRPRWDSLLAALGGAARANIVFVPVLHVLVLAAGNAFYACVYAAQHPLLERFRSLPEQPWHFSAAASPQQRAAFWASVRASVAVTLLNVALTVPLSLLNYSLAVRLGHSASLESFPSTASVLAHVLVFALVEDALFYIGHRTLHTVPFLYTNVHKVHHRWVQSVSIAAEATHPLEFVICNIVPFAAGPILTGAHLSLLYVWTVVRIAETVSHHAGYSFPTDVFDLTSIQCNTLPHDLHHTHGGGLAATSGNYGTFFRIWDTVLGTQMAEEPGEPAKKKS